MTNSHSPSSAASEGLKPCPFCGPGQSMVDPWFDDVSKRWAIGCGRCGASSGRSVHAEGSKEAAIKSWNTRGLTGDAAQSAGMRDALEFYANSKRYEGANTSPLPDDPFQPQELVYRLDVTRDGGRIARKALAAQPPAAPVETEEANYDRASSTAVAWIAFADDGKVRFWTSDERRAGDEKAKGLNLRAFTLAELVSLVSKLPHPGSSAASEPAAWLVTWTTKNNGPTASAYVRERDARDAARNVEKYADASNVVVAPAYTDLPQPSAATEEVEQLRRQLQIAKDQRNAWQKVAGQAGVCMTCAMGAPDPYGCTDCLNTGWEQGAPHGYMPIPTEPQAVSVAVDTTDYTELRASLADNITLFSHHKAALLRIVDAKIASTLSRPQEK